MCHLRVSHGLLAGTMRYFRASDIFGRKFTLSAEEPLGTYSYREDES